MLEEGKSPARQCWIAQAIRRHLGAELRAAYSEFVGAPIPNEHVDLLLLLRRRERSRKSSRSETA